MQPEDVTPPPNAPVIPEPTSFLDGLDAGGQDAADLDEPPQPNLPADEYDHDRDGTPKAAVPAPAPAAPAPVVPAPEPPKVVPIGELLSERQRRQEAERRLAELEAAKPAEPATPPPQPEPDVDYLEDPKGYVDQTVKRALAQLQKPIEQATTAAQQAQQTTAQQQAFQQIATSITQSEAAFQADHPDYNEALVHLRTQRMAELKVFQPEATEDQLLQYVRIEELRGAVAMLQAGRNPAQVAYEYAKLRGFTGKQAAPAPAPNGGVTPTPDEQERLRAQARGLPIGTGAGGLQQPQDQSNVFPEFDDARRERFGIGR